MGLIKKEQILSLGTAVVDREVSSSSIKTVIDTAFLA